MDLLSLEKIALHVARRHWGRAGLAPPLHDEAQWSGVARRVAEEFGANPIGTPEEIASAQGLELVWSHYTGTCGASIGNLLLVHPAKNVVETWIGFHHESSHVWVPRYLPGGNEADVWGVGLELAFPRWITPTARLELAARWRIPRVLLEAVAGLNALTPRPENDDGASLERIARLIDC